jgi:hypothetical protein
MKIGGWIGVGLVAASTISAAALVLGREQGLPHGSANGEYAHDCCGSLVLKNSEMVLGGKIKVGYVLGRDEAGPYILPDRFVGTWEERGFQLDGSRPPLKLRLDTLPKPASVQFTDFKASQLFKRKPSPLAGRRVASARTEP